MRSNLGLCVMLTAAILAWVGENQSLRATAQHSAIGGE